MRRDYLVCYDILNTKRLSKVHKYLYSLALGGQKSALCIPLSQNEMKSMIEHLSKLTTKVDLIHIIPIDPKPVCFGKNDLLTFENGAIIL